MSDSEGDKSPASSLDWLSDGSKAERDRLLVASLAGFLGAILQISKISAYEIEFEVVGTAVIMLKIGLAIAVGYTALTFALLAWNDYIAIGGPTLVRRLGYQTTDSAEASRRVDLLYRRLWAEGRQASAKYLSQTSVEQRSIFDEGHRAAVESAVEPVNKELLDAITHLNYKTGHVERTQIIWRLYFWGFVSTPFVIAMLSVLSLALSLAGTLAVRH